MARVLNAPVAVVALRLLSIDLTLLDAILPIPTLLLDSASGFNDF
jgi:hypothetical protein